MTFSDGADLGSTITAILESRACRSATYHHPRPRSSGWTANHSAKVHAFARAATDVLQTQNRPAAAGATADLGRVRAGLQQTR
jgi:hypothetical protein